MESQKKKLVNSIICVLVAFAVYKVFSVATDRLNINYYVLQVIKELVFSAAAFFAAFKLQKLHVLKWKSKGWGTGLLVGMYFFIVSCLSLTMVLVNVFAADRKPTIQSFEFVLLVVNVILIGLNEELLFRGVLQSCLHDYWGEDSVSAVKKAIVVTGLVFAFIHIFNILNGASVIGTVTQVIEVFPLGMLFATIYFRSHKNLWVGIFFHALYDFSGLLGGGALWGTKTTDVISSYNMVGGITMAIVILLIVLFVSRKKKLQKCIDEEKSF